MTESPHAPITELELVVENTNALAIKDAAISELIGTLKPIADLIPHYQKLGETVRVTNDVEAGNAAQMRDGMIADAAAAEKALREFDGKLVERLFKTHRAWTALIGRFSAINDAAKKVKQAILSWQSFEEEKARKEAARLQAAENERIRREQEKLEAHANKLKTPERAEALRERAKQLVPAVIHVQGPSKAVKSQTRWFVESVDKVAFAKAAASNPQLIGFLEVNEASLARAKASNEMFEADGITFVQQLV